jgi:sarcosine oxidase
MLTIGVAGLGAMGSMTALELARRGHRVIGFDRFHPPHERGSSHGKTRIIREAYFEHPQYVPLVQRAYELWPLLEHQSGATLYRPTGGLMIGPPEGTLVAGARRSALEHRLPFESLSPASVQQRFPAFHLSSAEIALYEPRAGVLFPEKAIEAALGLARQAGADLHFGEPVLSWQSETRIVLRTERREIAVDRLVLAAGAWMSGDLPGIRMPLSVARQCLFWFDGKPGAGDDLGRLPIFMWEWQSGRFFYGFPDWGDGMKVAIHHEGSPVAPDDQRTVQLSESRELASVMESRIPAVGPVREGTTCLYTNTPSGDFLLDRHPGDPRVMLASPCSGHGFKFSPAIGELLADLVEDRKPRFDLSPFGLDRLMQSS